VLNDCLLFMWAARLLNKFNCKSQGGGCPVPLIIFAEPSARYLESDLAEGFGHSKAFWRRLRAKAA
jgi:hypothetical protein